MEKKLAIIIPAYKNSFLEETIKSISNQTCKNFTLYIGDDASPHNIYEIVSKYTHVINIVYKRFEQNLGGRNLIAHWERCIDLSTEEWIWLFSDDDLMDDGCVEHFYKFILRNPEPELLHFDIQVIDNNGKVTEPVKPFPIQLDVGNFFAKRITYKIKSVVVEYIFKRALYNLKGGFENYDLAWCADDATWLKLGSKAGIFTIKGPYVKWRYSGENISSTIRDKSIVVRKLNATIKYIKWVDAFFFQNGVIDQTSKFVKMKWAISSVLETPSFTISEKFDLINKLLNELNYSNLYQISKVYLLYWELKQKVLNYIK